MLLSFPGKSCKAALKRGLFLISFFCVFATGASAQIKGLITQPSTSSGQLVLDPNKDGYVSTTKTGFSANDVAESEINYKALPQVSVEPSTDLGPGPDYGFTDLVDNGTNEQSISTFVDANNNLMFRFRVGSSSPNSKGYSILIDTDNKFGNSGANADQNYTSTNPGFEIEIVLRTNFGVDLNDVDGRSTPLTKTTLSYNDFSQKSIAFTTDHSDYDYFYDFYIPISTITTYFPGFSASTTNVRMVGTTVIAPKSALDGPISDLGGVNDATYNNNAASAWVALINNFVPQTLTGIKSGSSFSADRSNVPVITSPIVSSATSISGTYTEAIGTLINVYKNGNFLKSVTTIAAGTWTINTITVSAGDVITATATASGKSVSLASTEVIVGGTTCSAPPVQNCASDKGIIVDGPTGAAAGTIIKIYRLSTSGPQLISAGPTDATNHYSYKCNNSFSSCNSGQKCVVDGSYYFTATESGKCESVPSTYYVNGCTSSPTAPVITVKSTTALSGTTTVSGQTILISINDVFYGTATASTTLTSGTYAWSYSGFSAIAGQTISVRGIVNGGCATAASSATITEVATAPVITTTSIATNTTSISGTSIEANGSIITIYKNGVALGTATVNYGVWTLNASVSGFGLTSGDAITAKVTTATNKTISDASNSVTVSAATTRIPTITSPVKESATTISGTSTSPVGTVIKLYLDEDLIGQATVVFGAGGNTWSVTSIDPNYKLYPGGSLKATATETGLAESAPSTAVIITCELPVTTKTVTATNTCQTYTADVTISNPEAGVLYRLKSSATYYSSYAVALSGATSLVITTDVLPNVTTLTLTVEAMKIAPSSCTSNLTTTPTINVYGLPSDLTVGGATTICSGNSVNITVASSTSGISYQLRNGTTNVGSPFIGTGNTISLPTGNLTATTTFNVLATNSTTGCNRQLTNTPTVTVNAQQKTIAAVNNTVCSGGSTTIQVLNSENGTSYQLKDSATLTNIGSAVSSSVEGSTISLPTGAISATKTFIVVATKLGCTTTFTSTAKVTVGNPLSLPVTASFTTICSGSSINLTIANSEFGVNYQLKLGATNIGLPISGTGSSITPLALATINPTATTTSATYNYTVIATRSTGTCSATTINVPAITVNVQPVNQNVAATSSLICSGSSTNITVDNSQVGVNYQLRTGTTNVGSTVAGNGGTISLPTGTLTSSTTFNILATGATGGCSFTLITTPTVYVNGQKTVAAVSSTLCSGNATDITVANTVVGVNYELLNGTTSIVTIPGDGGTIGLPTGAINSTTTFTVKATNGACVITMTSTATVTISSPTASLLVSAPNSVCSGSSVNISVAGSESGVSYQLQTSAGANIGTPINGNGSTILLPTGALTSTTTFKVVATRALGGCVTTLNTQPSVTVNALPLVKTVTGPTPSICNGTSGTITVASTETGVSYILRNGTTVIDTKAGTGGTVSLTTGILTSSTTFNVIAATATCTTSLGNVTVTVIAQQKNVFAEQTSLCAGGSTNILVDLSGTNVKYQLQVAGTNVGTAVQGTGGTLSLPTGILNSTTTFTVLSYSASPNPTCTTYMAITPIVTITTPNAALSVNAPSSVCSGTSANITVANSENGVTYTLRNGVAVINSQAGNGGTLTFNSGNITSNTTFNILATNNSSGCAIQLTTTVTVEADCEAVYTPTSKTYASGYRFSPLEILATVTDADGFNSANTSTAVVTAGTLPSGISLNTTTGEIFASSVNSISAGNYAFGIRTTDKNGKTTDHLLSFIINTPGVPLPVEFISFNGKLADGTVNLDWATASEINNDYFTIERSADGIKFSEIGRQKGAGNSNEVLNYTFTDKNPMNGTSYYRVKQTDFNGDFDYTKTIAIRNYRNGESSVSINVYPNPVVNGTVIINIAGSQGEMLQLLVIDALGKTEINKSVLMQDNFTSLNLVSQSGNKLKPGIYTLITHVKNETFTTKLIIN